MFNPKYTITDKLLANIKHVNSLVLELNNKNFPQTVLVEFEKEARAISTYASTTIEGNPLPLTVVKQVLKTQPQNLRTSEQEVLNYNKALEQLNRILNKGQVSLPELSSGFLTHRGETPYRKPQETSIHSRHENTGLSGTGADFNLELILSIHKQITDKLIPDFQIGKLRKEPVFINNPKTGETIFLPPDHKDVPKLLDELINFINGNKEKIDSLILSAIFHKQFVLIHPFMDGNGRTARLATSVLLSEIRLNIFNLFSFENYYNKNITNYFNQVGELGNYYDLASKIDFTNWLEYFTEGIIDELLRVKKELPESSPSPETELKPYHHQILNYIKEKGYIQDKNYALLVKRAKATRTLDFTKLINLGLIERLGKGKATYYVLKKKP